MKAQKKFTVTIGSAVVTIYPLADRNRFCLSYYVDTKRHREIRSHLKDAEQRAEETKALAERLGNIERNTLASARNTATVAKQFQGANVVVEKGGE